MDDLKRKIDAAKRIVFLGGAGVSTESNIPDFRSSDGVYRTKKRYGLSPETILSEDFFYGYPEIFFEYYRNFLLYPNAKPNPAHYALAKLEQTGKLTHIVTQNIDGLHQKAGSKSVLELHGSVYRNHCIACGKAYSLEDILAKEGVPQCICGGTIKPDVVLYGENLDQRVLYDSVDAIKNADLLMVGGTSLAVYPAAGLIDFFAGKELVVINLSSTPRDHESTLLIQKPIGQALSFLLN